MDRHSSGYIIAAILAAVAMTTSGSLPTLTQEQLADVYGNQADADSVVSWTDSLPSGQTYNSDISHNSPLTVYYSMVNGFLNVVQPNGFPSELITGVVNDGIGSITDDYMSVVMYILGFAICFAIGFLFILFAPIVGCCMCCCRTCCNKCGGKKFQKFDKRNKCKKNAFCVCLLVCTIFMAVGTICMIVTNDELSKAIGHLGTDLSGNLQDVSIFFNNTVLQIEVVAVGGLNFTTLVLLRDLDSIGYLLGIPTRNSIDATLNLDTVLNDIKVFETTLDNVGSAMRAVNTSQVDLQVAGDDLSLALDGVAAKVEAAKTNCSPCAAGLDTSSLKMDANFSMLPDISTELSKLDSAQSKDLGQLVQDSRSEFDDIPWRVENDTAGMRSDITTMINDLLTEVNSALTPLNDMKSMASDFVSPVSDQITSYTDMASEYDLFRWYGGLGLACLIGGITLLQLIGLMCGCFGTCKDTLPTERGCIPNSGGNCLMAASGFIFMFSWILTLLLNIFFLLGGNVEKLVCQPLTVPPLDIMDLLEGPTGIVVKPGYLIPSYLFSDDTVQLPIKDVLSSCENNEAAMSALQLYRMNGLDFNSFLDWRQYVDLDDEIDNIDVDLSGVTIVSADMESQLNDFKDSVGIDYQGFVDELQKNTTQADLVAFEAQLRVLHGSFPAAGFDDAADDLDSVITGIYTDVKNAQQQLLDDIIALNSSTQDVPDNVDNLLNSAKDVESQIHNNASDIIKQEAGVYKTRLEGVIDSFVGYANDSIYTDIGGCQPVYNLYMSMIGVSICSNFVDNINGFWFGLGMCVFFMVPSLIFNVKLAKHFRRMKYIEGYDKPSVDPVPQVITNEKPPIFAGNKVTPDWNYDAPNAW